MIRTSLPGLGNKGAARLTGLAPVVATRVRG